MCHIAIAAFMSYYSITYDQKNPPSPAELRRRKTQAELNEMQRQADERQRQAAKALRVNRQAMLVLCAGILVIAAVAMGLVP